MTVLAIETSSDQFGVALRGEARVVAAYEVLAERPHAVELPQAVARVLRAGQTTLARLNALVVDVGPGSFTGLRVGVAFVKALAFQSQRPVVAVPSLDVLAAQVPFAAARICPIIDAKRRQVYTAAYQYVDGQLVRQADPQLIALDAWLPAIKRAPTIFLGDAVALYRARIEERLGTQARFAEPELWLPRAATLSRLGLERLARGDTADPAALVPLYLYPMDCTIRRGIPLSGATTMTSSP